MLTAEKIAWNQARYFWSDFKLGADYQQYLLDVYGITVDAGGRVIWNHVLNVIEIAIQLGGAPPYPDQLQGLTKKAKKRVKLIFIMEGKEKTQIKEIKNISKAAIFDIQNHIEEQLKTKVTLSDVQIIKG